MQAHEIDYHIYGEEMQYVEIELDPQEVVIAEAGSFMMMEDGIKMETIFGDGSQEQQSGIFGKLLSAGKRVLTGESLFMTAYQNQGFGKRKVSFASPYPGKIVPIDLRQFGGKFICQKDSFLCAAKGVAVGIEFSRKIGTSSSLMPSFTLSACSFCIFFAASALMPCTFPKQSINPM